jgi:hypothetical protein
MYRSSGTENRVIEFPKNMLQLLIISFLTDITTSALIPDYLPERQPHKRPASLKIPYSTMQALREANKRSRALFKKTVDHKEESSDDDSSDEEDPLKTRRHRRALKGHRELSPSFYLIVCLNYIRLYACIPHCDSSHLPRRVHHSQ